MNEFLGFVKKEFYHIFRDTRTMIILFGIPVALIMIFGYVISNELKDVKIAILDRSKDEVTTGVTNKILSSGYFQLWDYLSEGDDFDEIFQQGRIKEIIVFEAGFAEKLERDGEATIQIIADASDANSANMAVSYTEGIIRNYSQQINQNKSIPLRIEPETRMFYNEQLQGGYMYIPGTITLILMLVSAMMTSISIAREKELGTMEVLLISPLKPAMIIIGKVVPYVALSFINTLVIIYLGYEIFGVPVRGSLLLLLAESLLFILMALSLGILISTASNSQQTAMFISLFVLMLPTILLSGFIFPISNMPEILQWLSTIMPARWFIVIVKNIMVKGTGMAYVWKETLIIAGMAVLFIGLSVKKFKIRLE